MHSVVERNGALVQHEELNTQHCSGLSSALSYKNQLIFSQLLDTENYTELKFLSMVIMDNSVTHCRDFPHCIIATSKECVSVTYLIYGTLCSDGSYVVSIS